VVKNYIGKKCWQATSQVSIRVGSVVRQDMRDGWLVVLVMWRDRLATWERVANVSFDLENVC